MAFSLKGIGSGLKGAFQNEDFVNAMASMQGSGGDDIFSKIMGGLGKGAGMAQQFKRAQTQAGGGAPPKPIDNSDVPLALPPGTVMPRTGGLIGGKPPGVGVAGVGGYNLPPEPIPGAADTGPAPSPDSIGMEGMGEPLTPSPLGPGGKPGLEPPGPPPKYTEGGASPFSKFAGGEDDYIRKALRGMGQMGSMGF
jgi:hypothetical protein